MNDRYREILNSLGTKEEETFEPKGINDRVLIVDSLNTFIRSFAVIQHINKQGNHIGGLTGFLKSVGYAISLVRPTRVILVFDGQGGSTNKRYLYPEYKANRGYRRITNWDSFESQEQESESITNQIVRLVDYLKCLPVDLLSIDKIEADDVIGCMAMDLPGEVTIMSSDRDYLQLVSERINVYSPIKKKFYYPKTVLEEYNTTPQNFLNQKVLLGDKGDNVPGITGFGPKTLIKCYPELSEEKTYTLDELLNKAKTSKGKAFENIRNFESQLRINEKLMDLKEPNIPEESLLEIQYVIENPNKGFKSNEFIELYNQDDLGESIRNVKMWLFDKFQILATKYQ
jgi:DNA polymerase-1